MIEYFIDWTESFSPTTVQDAYTDGALPVISWQPFDGDASQLDQPDYSLSTIIDGDHDPYITEFAEAVKAARVPIAIRFAHEMNGNWYPWSEGVNGNQPGQYAEAWRHVYDIFTAVGADNVIWVWSPNILRGTAGRNVEDYYPGDAYVDWIGLTGYAVTESTAAQVFDPTLAEIRSFTQKKILITETGAQPGPEKDPWVGNFFSWLQQQPDVIGFIWFDYYEDQGAGADWTFASDPVSLAEFQRGVQAMTRVTMPTAAGPSS